MTDTAELQDPLNMLSWNADVTVLRHNTNSAKFHGAGVCAYYDDLTPCLWRPALIALPSVPCTTCSKHKPTSCT
jgi:hypothetical protein